MSDGNEQLREAREIAAARRAAEDVAANAAAHTETERVLALGVMRLAAALSVSGGGDHCEGCRNARAWSGVECAIHGPVSRHWSAAGDENERLREFVSGVRHLVECEWRLRDHNPVLVLNTIEQELAALAEGEPATETSG